VTSADSVCLFSLASYASTVIV